MTELVVRVESAELLYTLVTDEGEVCLHEQRRRILTGRSCLLIAGAVLKHINRCDPLLPGVLESTVFSGVIFRFFPLRPHLEELLHREQFPTLEHLVNILLPLGVGLGAREGSGVGLEPAGELVANRLKKALDRLVPRLIGERPSDFLDADALVKAHRLGVELEVDLSLLAVLSGHCLPGVVLAVVDVDDLRDASGLAVNHLDQRLF